MTVRSAVSLSPAQDLQNALLCVSQGGWGRAALTALQTSVGQNKLG